jgi:hypothetical protein
MRQALLLSAGGVVADVAVHGLHGGGSWLGLGALAGGWIWLARGQMGRSLPLRPKTVESWSERCQNLLAEFAQLDSNPESVESRSTALEELLSAQERMGLRLALVGSGRLPEDHLCSLQVALRGPLPLQLVVSEPLPTNSSRWQWSGAFASSDALVFHLQPPLMAADLRWLEALPEDLPLWVLLEANGQGSLDAWLTDLCSQWPGPDPSESSSGMVHRMRWRAVWLRSPNGWPRKANTSPSPPSAGAWSNCMGGGRPTSNACDG